MSLTAWVVFYLFQICCWCCLYPPSRKGGRDERAASLIVWLGFVGFSTVMFLVGLRHPDLRHFLLRLE